MKKIIWLQNNALVDFYFNSAFCLHESKRLSKRDIFSPNPFRLQSQKKLTFYVILHAISNKTLLPPKYQTATEAT